MKYKVALVADFDTCPEGHWDGNIIQFEFSADWKASIEEFYKETKDEHLDILKLEYEVDILHLIVTTSAGRLVHCEVVIETGVE